MSTEKKHQEEVDILEQSTPQHEIILYNDDINTFDFVIDALIEICNHSSIQAEQCTMLVHYKGKCSVKKGEFNDLKAPCLQLLERGLSAKIH